jgi:outer membrane lipopolysaccharide assembly protein LptE/RlpB
MIVPYSKFSTAWLLLLAALANIGCGYRLAGRGRNLPAAAQTIAIPEFKNDSRQSRAARFVTAAIREEFIARTRLRLGESTEKADLLLDGRISAFETVPLSYSDHGASQHFEVRITVNVRLIDMKKNELFYEGTGLGFREIYEAVGSDFFSQAAGAQGKIAANFAASVVSSILNNF